MGVKRSAEMFDVAYFLARYGESGREGKKPRPPRELGVRKWKQAYRAFLNVLVKAGRLSLSVAASRTLAMRSTVTWIQGEPDGAIRLIDENPCRFPINPGALSTSGKADLVQNSGAL